MALGFGLKGQGLIPDAAKDPLSACSVCAHKICGSESPVVGLQQSTMGVVSGENFPPFERYTKFVEVEMDGADICLKEAEIELLPLSKMGLASKEQRTPFTLN